MWLVLVLLAAVCHAQNTCESVDPAINTIGKCFKYNVTTPTSLSLGFWGWATYRHDGNNYLVNSHKTVDEFWNVNDPFEPRLIKRITGLNQCRGFVYANNQKFGHYFVHFGGYQSYCNCVQGKPCIPFLNFTNNGVVSQFKICDNSEYPVSKKDVSAPAALTDPLDGCDTITTNLTGKVAVIQRGACAFQTKLDNAVAQGAVAVVIVNGINTAGTGECIEPGVEPINTPTVMISYDDGLSIKTAIEAGHNVILSLGPSSYINYNSAQSTAPFGGVWGSSQNITVASFEATTADDYVPFSDESYQSFYNPSSVIGLSKRPDAETTEYFIVVNQSHAIVAHVEDGEFYLVSKPFAVPDTLDFGISILFVRGEKYWLATPNFLGGEATIYSLGNIGEGKVPLLARYSSVTDVGNQVALPIPPLNNYLYTNDAAFGEEGVCPRRYNIYDITFMFSPSHVNSFQTHMKDDTSTDQLNDGDFLEAEDGTIIGAVCGASEGILLYNANNPAKPVMSGVYDSSVTEYDFQTGASACSAGTDGLTWWFQDVHEKSICAVQLAYGPGSANSGSSIVLNVFVGLMAGLLAMQW